MDTFRDNDNVLAWNDEQFFIETPINNKEELVMLSNRTVDTVNKLDLSHLDVKEKVNVSIGLSFRDNINNPNRYFLDIVDNCEKTLEEALSIGKNSIYMLEEDWGKKFDATKDISDIIMK